MLLAAQRAVIYAGGGAVTGDAHEALVAIAEHLQAGIATTAEGQGVVDHAHDPPPRARVGPKNPLRRWLDAADLILVVGSRLQVSGFQPTQQVIQVDVDPDEIGRSHGLTFGLVGDARLTLERLLERLRASAPRPSRKAEREALRAEMAALDTTEPNAPILKSLRAGTPEDAIPRKGGGAGGGEAFSPPPNLRSPAAAWGGARRPTENPPGAGVRGRGAPAPTRRALMGVGGARVPPPPFFMPLKAPDKYKT